MLQKLIKLVLIIINKYVLNDFNLNKKSLQFSNVVIYYYLLRYIKQQRKENKIIGKEGFKVTLFCVPRQKRSSQSESVRIFILSILFTYKA